MLEVKINIITLTVVFTMAASTPHCDRGWVLHRKSCYYFSASTVSFMDAMIACYNFRANLLEFKDFQEEKWVDIHCRIRGYTYGIWLGFIDIQSEGQYVSLSGAGKPRYVNWIKGQPDNYYGGEHCASYFIKYKGWNDSQCSRKINFVCTKEINTK